MTELAATAPPPGPEPVPILSGHLVIYDDTAAGRGHVIVFRDDAAPPDSDPVMPMLPAMVVPLLAKVLRGEELTTDDIPGGLGMLGRMKGLLGNGFGT